MIRTDVEPADATGVVIVGAGFGGIAAAVELRRHGVTDVVLLEAADELGGTWWHNTYPGAACDVPSAGYCFSFAQDWPWSRSCAPQSEILAYLRAVARDTGVDGLVRTRTRVARADWADGEWTVTATDGRTWRAPALVVATGQLNRPAVPALPGAGTFAGPAFHTARWDHAVDLRGRRVAVVGTGASAVQVVPALAPDVERLVVFQRSGSWLLPRRHQPRRLPGGDRPRVRRLRRAATMRLLDLLTATIRHPHTLGRVGRLASTAFMWTQLRGGDLRRRAWPGDPFGCKRILFSSDYLPALRRPDVDLEVDPIARVEPDAIVTRGGTRHPVDVLVYATGFKTTELVFPLEVTGVGGRTLRDAWAAGAHAHLGMTVPGFPSLFVLYGPNTNTSGGSIIAFLEAQAGYVRQAIQHAAAAGRPGRLDVRADVEAASDAATQAAFAGTAWLGCDSWYRDEAGRIVANWPGYQDGYARRVRRLDPADFRWA